MKPYFSIGSTGARTSILGYDYDATSMTVYFDRGQVYTYTLASCGPEHLVNMKKLADSGGGLNRYLSQFRPPYVSKR